MSEEAGLMRAIVANPEEDTPRLMYADWLQENGYPDRADFIRIQCALAKGGLDPEEELELMGRERSFKPRLKEWSHLGPCEFRRGIGEKVTMHPVALAETSQALLGRMARGYAIMALRIVSPGSGAAGIDSLMALIGNDVATRNEALRAQEPAACQKLIDRKELARLFEVDLSNSQPSESLLTLLQQCRHLHRVTVLELNGANLQQVRPLDNPVSLVNVKKLSLAGNGLTREGVAPLIDNPAMEKVEMLDLSNNRITGTTILDLVASLSRLKALDVRDNSIQKKMKVRIRELMEGREGTAAV
jgi:uncharacterized protein (TIGR02996 family)